MLVALCLVLGADPEPPAADPPPARPAAPDLGMGGMGGGGGPGYSATWYPATSVQGQPAELEMVRQRLNVGYPLWRGGDGDLLLGTARVGHTLLNSDALLPDSRRPVPAELWDIGLGGVYVRQLGDGRTGGLMLNVGSASDRPFNGLREMQVSGGGFVRLPAARDGDFWNLALFYSPTGQLPFPVPGVSYQWRASDTLRVNLGVPFSATWTPTDTFTLTASYMPLTIVNVRATWRPHDRLALFAGYESAADGFFLAGREDRRDRFQLLEQRLLAGAGVTVIEQVRLDVTGGWAFGRTLGSGRNPLNTSTDRLEIDPGPFLGLTLSRRF